MMARAARKWVFFLPVLLGVAAVAVFKQGREAPQQAPVAEKPVLVRVMAAPRLAVRPRASGHGTVRPSRSWEAVAQVKGRILEKHPKLQKGAILAQGALLLRIDPAEYRLRIAQIEADIAATRAQLDEAAVKGDNIRAALAVERQALELAQKALERKKDLAVKGGVSRSDLEAQERTLLAQRQSVLTQRSSLNLLPAQRALLEARAAGLEAQLESARRDLANTEVRLPFDGRVAAVNVEQAQYVREGEVLAVADDMHRAEVEVQIPLERFASVIRSEGVLNLLPGAGVELGPERLHVEAEVRFDEGEIHARWAARFARVSDTLDPETRTVGVIVEVDEPYSDVQPGIRPPLLKGLFVEVVLTGPPAAELPVIPRSAYRNGRVLVADADDRLVIRPVTPALMQPGYLAIESGLEGGERVILSDLSPAIAGRLLQPRLDEAARQRLNAEAN